MNIITEATRRANAKLFAKTGTLPIAKVESTPNKIGVTTTAPKTTMAVSLVTKLENLPTSNEGVFSLPSTISY